MKKKLFGILAILAITALNNIVNAQCVSDENNVYAFEYDGKNYEVVKENLNWENAAACAVERGGYLSEIDSYQEQNNIFNQVLNYAGITASETIAWDGGGASYLWLGGNDITTEEKWIWDGDNDGTGVHFWQGKADGSPVNYLYNNWGNEPDNYSNQDGLGLAYTDWPLGNAGQWNDVKTSNKLYYIIEYPESSGLDKIESGIKMKVYPNPVKQKINIEIPGEYKIDSQSSVKIYDIYGKLIKVADINNRKIEIDIECFPNGTYFISFKNSNISSAPQRIVIVN